MRTLLVCFIVIVFSGCSWFSSADRTVLYRVRSGDSLGKIAETFGVDREEIVKQNRLQDADYLVVGQILEFPAYQKRNMVGNHLQELQFGTKDDGERHQGSQKIKKKLGNLLLTWPVNRKLFRLSSRFGKRWFSFHEGIDLAAKEGSPIYAAHAGTVIYSGKRLRGYGNVILIRNHELLTVYGHNYKNYVRSGQVVQAGEQIGEVGKTGKATGPHLHFELRTFMNGRFISTDALKYLSK